MRHDDLRRLAPLSPCLADADAMVLGVLLLRGQGGPPRPQHAHAASLGRLGGPAGLAGWLGGRGQRRPQLAGLRAVSASGVRNPPPNSWNGGTLRRVGHSRWCIGDVL